VGYRGFNWYLRSNLVVDGRRERSRSIISIVSRQRQQRTPRPWRSPVGSIDHGDDGDQATIAAAKFIELIPLIRKNDIPDTSTTIRTRQITPLT
jgi:hypothetical protein